MLTASANYTRDIHQRYIQPGTRRTRCCGRHLASLAGLLALLMAWKMRDIIDILQLGFTINSAGLFLPTILAIYSRRVPASARLLEHDRVIVTRHAGASRPTRARRLFAVDPLWPGLLISVSCSSACGVRQAAHRGSGRLIRRG